MKKKLLFLFVIYLNLSMSYNQDKGLISHQITILDSVRVPFYKNLTLIESNDVLFELLIPVANSLNTKAEYLYAVIQHESHGHITALNSNTNAVGLIQFMPSTLAGWNITTDSCYNMNMFEQVQLVERYYKPYSDYNLNNPIKLFLCTFYPYGLRQWNNNEYIFGSERSIQYANKVANWNKGFDLDKNSLITMEEYKIYHYNLLNKI